MFFRIFAEEIQEHQNLDDANEYKQFYQFDKCTFDIIKKVLLYQFLQIVSFHPLVAILRTQVVPGLGCCVERQDIALNHHVEVNKM